MLRNCEICNHPDIETIHKEFFNKQITGVEAADQLEVTLSKFRNHINFHVKNDITAYTSDTAIELSKMFIDKVGELMDSLDRNKDQIESVLGELKNVGVDKDLLNVYVKLETLLGQQIERLAKLQGEMKDANMIKIQQMVFQLNKIQAVVLENVSDPEVKMKIVKVLEKEE